MFLWDSRHRLSFLAPIWNLKEIIFPHVLYWPFDNQVNVPLEDVIVPTGIVGYSLENPYGQPWSNAELSVAQLRVASLLPYAAWIMGIRLLPTLVN
jgi:hypothetical protein